MKVVLLNLFSDCLIVFFFKLVSQKQKAISSTTVPQDSKFAAIENQIWLLHY